MSGKTPREHEGENLVRNQDKEGEPILLGVTKMTTNPQIRLNKRWIIQKRSESFRSLCMQVFEREWPCRVLQIVVGGLGGKEEGK